MVNIKTKPGKLNFPYIPMFTYQKTLAQEVEKNNLTRKDCLKLLEQMYMIRALEEMLVEISSGIYKTLPGYDYIGPTHLSIGQEATSVGAISAIGPDDYITSSHRGHGDAMAKGCSVISSIKLEYLKELLKKREKYLLSIGGKIDDKDSRDEIEEKALKIHVYRMIAELFGKADGYCRGVGGGMHIADFELGHLGANAIVGGHVGIATGAAMSSRYQKDGKIVLCLAGDGAYSNGVVLESLNLSTMAQFKNGLMSNKFGVPIIYGIVNNQYAMSGQENGEITGIDYLARRAAAFNLNVMHAEVVDGMNVLAVRDATKRASILIKEGKGPVLLEFVTYRYKGHSLSDPLTYRDREELTLWQKKDPIKTFIQELLKTKFSEEFGGKVTEDEIKALKEKVYKRNSEMAVISSRAVNPANDSLLRFVFSEKKSQEVPEKFSNSKNQNSIIQCKKRNNNDQINMRLAIREALVEEMDRDLRVIIFGEDVADYGGAFGVTNGLLKIFGRDRVFNTSISESGIIGVAVGMAMTGIIPVVELMYNDFILEAMDQIGNQAAKWSYMSGGQISVPMVVRTTIGGGKGYAGQHSQSLEAITAHIPGLIIIAPSNSYDAKGLLKAAIRENNPVIFFEHQLTYNLQGKVPTAEYLIPIGKADIKRKGTDITVISWSYMVNESLKAAAILEDEGISVEVIDIRTLIPLDIETILASVKKTSKVVVTSQEVAQSGFNSEIITLIQEQAFDWLDAPILRLCAPNCSPPSAQNLEKLFLPDADKLVKLIKDNFYSHLYKYNKF